MATNYARNLFDEFAAPTLDADARWARVVKLTTDKEPESLWLDFKSVRPDTKPSDDTYVKEILAKSLSAFANTEGGVLIYGVSSKTGNKGEPDRAEAIAALTDAGRFRVAIEKLASKLVDPVIEKVIVTEVVDPSNKPGGVVVLYIPPSEGGPHRCVQSTEGVNDRYYMRTTTECVAMAHSTLADRFGRTARPQLQLRIHPRLEPQTIVIYFWLLNTGRGVARWPAVQIVNQPRELNYVTGTAFEGFVAVQSRTADGVARLTLAPGGDAVVYPGTECMIGIARLDAKRAPSVPWVDLHFTVSLYAIDMQPVRGQGTLGFNHLSGPAHEVEAEVLVLPDE